MQKTLIPSQITPNDFFHVYIFYFESYHLFAYISKICKYITKILQNAADRNLFFEQNETLTLYYCSFDGLKVLR